MTDITIKGEVSLDASKADAGLAQVESRAVKMADAVKKSGAEAGKAVDGIGAGSDGSAKKIDQSTKSIINSIQRTTAAMQAGEQGSSKYYEALAQQRGANVDVLRPYLIQLDAAKAKQDIATRSLGNMGVSAKQTAAALRGVPAQFTDIVTSLQGGQAPLTVMLQQGGQLKDMFGGIGGAARALGGYIVGLINPFTLAAGALGVIGTAAFQGSKELEAFNKTLILNGGTSGVTADNLMSMAASIDAVNYGISQSKAAETIDEIVKAGVRGETQILRYAQAAAEFEQAGGGAATEVAKAFAELGKDPLQASVKLTQSMGYLTEATYLQIKALEDQGRTVDAARVAQEAYADALTNRTPQLLENLGALQRGWNGIKGAAAEAWGAMLNIGRAQTLGDQVSAVERRLEQARSNRYTVGVGGKFDAVDPRKGADEALLSSLKEQQRLASRSADINAERAQHEKDRINFMAQGDKHLTSEQRQQREILAVQQLRIKGTITEREEEQRIAAIREKNAKAPARARRSGREGDPFAADREAAKGWADAFGDFSKLALDAEGKALGLSKAQQRLVEFLGSPAYQNSSEPMKELALQQAYVAIAAEQAAEALKKEQAAIEASVNAMATLVEKQQGGAADIQEQVRQQKEATAAYGLSGEALLELETSRLMDAAAERERQAVIADGIDLSGMLGQAYRDEAIALRELAAAKKNDATVRQQTDQYRAMWQGIEGFAENAFMDIALNGEDAFKRIGESIKKEILQLLYEMTVKKWILQISGTGGGSSGGSLVDYASSAYSAYSTGAAGGAGSAGAVGGSASAIGSYAGGSMSAANAYGSIYANTTGTGINGLLATNGAYGTAGAGGAAGSGAASSIGYLGYAALIAAAVLVAENLYSKGYNRAALGKGPGESNSVGNTTFTADSRVGKSNVYNGSPENFNRELGDAIGINKKWSDILSGTTRMATLFGRKLGAYGFTADIAGGDAEVGGFTRYKGGVFRSNKTVKTDIDPRDAANFDAVVESTIEGAKGMARAMGYSDEAINKYTGSLKVNFKGAKTAEEQAERMATAMEDLNYELLKTASGGKFARDEFNAMMEGIQKDIENAGISTAGITDILANGIVNGLSGEEIGAQLSQNIMGGIYTTMSQNAFAPVASALMQQIITPMFTAMAAGIPLAQALNAAALKNVVQMANDAAAMLNEIFNNEEFRAAMDAIGSALGSIGGAAGSVNLPPIRSVRQTSPTVDTAKREREQLEMELLRLQGDTVEIRRRERMALQASNRALYDRVKALEDEQAIMEERKDLERQLMEIRGETVKIQALEREALNEANRALYDEVINAQRIADLKEAWKGLTDSIEEEVKRIRGQMLADTPDGLTYLRAQFAIDTEAARAGDQEAAARLPDISSSLIEAGEMQSATLSDFQFLQGSIAASLEETNRIARLSNGVTTAAVEDKALAAQVASLQSSVNTNTAEVIRLTGIFAKVTNGPALRTVSV